MGYGPWGCKESDTIERLNNNSMKRLMSDLSNKDRGITGRNTRAILERLYLCEELREAEDRPVVEDRVVEDVGKHPGERVEGPLGWRGLPAQLQAEAGVVETAHGQRELQQVVLGLRLVPPSLRSHKERTTLECRGQTPSSLWGRRALPRAEQLSHPRSREPPNSW